MARAIVNALAGDQTPANQHGPTHNVNLLTQIAAQVTIV